MTGARGRRCTSDYARSLVAADGGIGRGVAVKQDADKQLDLRAWGKVVMARAEAEHPGLRWFAVEHQDPDHRHVHAVALSRERLDIDDFRSMRAAADDNAREQGARDRERDQVADRDR
jgi:hypothetical protein